MITRKDAQEAKVRTRAMVKASNEKKISLGEAKRRQKIMLQKGNDSSATAIKDIYGNVKSLQFLPLFFNLINIYRL